MRRRVEKNPENQPNFASDSLVLSDEDWVGLAGVERDADYFERVFVDTGVDRRSV